MSLKYDPFFDSTWQKNTSKWALVKKRFRVSGLCTRVIFILKPYLPRDNFYIFKESRNLRMQVRTLTTDRTVLFSLMSPTLGFLILFIGIGGGRHWYRCKMSKSGRVKCLIYTYISYKEGGWVKLLCVCKWMFIINA